MSIAKARAFVTGGSSGLGAVVARRLAREGASVVLSYRAGRDRAEAVCAGIQEGGGQVTAVQMDQSDPASIDAAVAQSVDRLGGLDILVNNAGMASGGHRLPAGDLDAFTPEIWDQMMNVNVRGPYLVTRAAAPALRAGLGRVVNIGSTIGHGAWRADAAFAPSKGAVAPLTRFLAAALAPDITVNCVAPGMIEGTGMSGGAPDAYVESWRDRSVLGKTTRIDDVAEHVLAFCRSAAVTGQVLVVDGGVHFR